MFLSFLIYCVFLLVEKLGLSRSTKFETIFLSEETRDSRLSVVKKISPDIQSGLIGNFSYGAGLMLFS